MHHTRPECELSLPIPLSVPIAFTIRSYLLLNMVGDKLCYFCYKEETFRLLRQAHRFKMSPKQLMEYSISGFQRDNASCYSSKALSHLTQI